VVRILMYVGRTNSATRPAACHRIVVRETERVYVVRVGNPLGGPQGTPLRVGGNGRIEGYVPLRSLGPLESHLFELSKVEARPLGPQPRRGEIGERRRAGSWEWRRMERLA